MIERNYEIVGAAFGLASYDRGNVRAPAALRKAGLVERLRHLESSGFKISDAGDLPEPEIKSSSHPNNLKFLPEVLEFSEQLIPVLRRVYAEQKTPVLIGGDHSISIASISVAAEVLKQRGGEKSNLGILWVDAHSDINTPETSPSGNIHGMSIAHLLGSGDSRLAGMCGFTGKIKPEDVIYLGLRDVDPGEKLLLKQLGVKAYTMSDIDRYGIGEICTRVFEQLERQCSSFVLSFDLDVCDPWIAPGVGLPVRGGLTYRESHFIMEMAARTKNLMSVEMVEYNPDMDVNGLTAEVAIGLVESALGKTIL